MEHREELPRIFEACNVLGVGAEIGVWYGYYSNEIAKIYTGKILSIDKWTNTEDYERAKDLLKDTKCVLIQGYSQEVAKTIPDESLDFVYIDADHDYDNIKADYEAWFPKLRKGGVMSGHDYGDDNGFGVKQYIDELGVPFETTTNDTWEGRKYNSWWLIK